MSTNNPPKDNIDGNHYGMAVEEIKLERSIRNLTNIMNNYKASNRPQYLSEEIALQQKQLLSIRESRSSR